MRKVSWLIMVAILLSTLVVGQATAAKTKLLWTTCCGQADRMEIFGSLAKQYTAENPDVEVEMVYPTGSYANTLKTWIAAGTGADVMWLGGALWSFTDLLLPLNDLVAKDKNVASIYQQILKSATWDGNQIGLPYGINTNVIAYDKELFDTSGVAYPTVNWTFADVISISKKISKDTDGNGTTDIWGTGRYEYKPHMAQGGDFYTSDSRRAAFNNPIAAEALKSINDINSNVNGVAIPDTISSQSTFIDKKLGMMIIGPFTMPTFRTSAKFDWDVVPWPGLMQNGKRYDSAFVSLESWTINKASKNPEEAKKFVAWLFRSDVMKQISRLGVVIPSQPQQAANFMSQAAPPKNLNAFIQSINYTHRYVYDHPVGQTVESTILATSNAIYREMITGLTPVASALPELEKQVNAVLDEFWAQRGK